MPQIFLARFLLLFRCPRLQIASDSASPLLFVSSLAVIKEMSSEEEPLFALVHVDVTPWEIADRLNHVSGECMNRTGAVREPEQKGLFIASMRDDGRCSPPPLHNGGRRASKN